MGPSKIKNSLFMELKVLYEDNHIIAVYKPSGVLIQGGGKSLMDEVRLYLKEKHKKPGNVFLGLVHRLDRPVSGIVLFAKTSKGASRLSEQFRSHKIKKTYHAIVVGKAKKGNIKSYIIKDEEKKKAAVYNYYKPGSKIAELEYEAVKSRDKCALLKIKPKSGRFHQIRAQLSSIGFPIVGDIKYGAKEIMPDKSICLCSTSISFSLAIKDEAKTISVPYPKEWENLF